MNKIHETDKLSDIIKRRKNEAAIRIAYITLIQRILFLAFAGYLVFTQIFLITRGTGNGMLPAMKDGDLIIGYRLEGEYEKNDVVTYKVNGIRHIGRILAKETDVVTIGESGTLLVNGTAQGGEIFYPTYPKEGNQYPYRVPENSVFVLGDYRTQTMDSRDFGPISMDDIEGKVITILRRRGL